MKNIFIKILGLNNYHRLLKCIYFIIYITGIVKYNSKYEYHYFIRHLIDKGDIIINFGAKSGFYSFLLTKWTGNTGKVITVEDHTTNPSALFEDMDRINYIKCDKEGLEYSILSDMREIIEKFNPIVQVNVFPDNRKEILELFDELGYTPYKLYNYQLIPQVENNDSLSGDYFFINN